MEKGNMEMSTSSAHVPSSEADEDKEEALKIVLFKNAMQGNWREVVDMYKKHGSIAHRAQITKYGDTAIRIAISEGKGCESIVEELVAAARKTPGALAIQNDYGYTPLHLAALEGNVRMCRCIAKADLELIGIRNENSATPFFLAVHFGKKDAFLLLAALCKDKGYQYGRRYDGETILHTAISRQYYDIAFEIIHRYPKFVYSANEKGLSPLHLLASTPSSFRSGSENSIRGFYYIIYKCIRVNELKSRSEDEANKKQSLLRDRIGALMGSGTKRSAQQLDAENPDDQQGGSIENTHDDKRADVELEQPKTHFVGLKRIYKMMLVIVRAMLIIIGTGPIPIEKIRMTKQKNIWSAQIMRELVKVLYQYNYLYDGRDPDPKRSNRNRRSIVSDDTTPPVTTDDSLKAKQNKEEKDVTIGEAEAQDSAKLDEKNKEKQSDGTSKGGKYKKELEMIKRKETPVLVAAKNGVVEIVQEIFDHFEEAMYDTNNEDKNVVLLAVENRKPLVFEFLRERKKLKETMFGQKDTEGNSALHLAAKLPPDDEPWPVPGAAMQMQYEMTWYEYVNHSMGHHFFAWYNNKGDSPEDVFKETHKKMLTDGNQWLSNTSENFSVVAGLIATVAFATSAIVPGGVNENGAPTLEDQTAFSVFAVSSLIALCFSIASVVLFLEVLISKYQNIEFGQETSQDLPRKFMLGLTSLFLSIASMLISFCAGHSFVMKDQLKYASVPVYAITCLVVTFVAITQFPFYFDLLVVTFTGKPKWRQK